MNSPLIITKKNSHGKTCKVTQINCRRQLWLIFVFLKSVFAVILLVVGVILLLVNLRKPLC